MDKKNICINGQYYDATTGQPIASVIEPAPSRPPSPEHRRGTTHTALHAAPVQTSTMLNRRYVKQPQRPPLAARPQRTRADVPLNTQITRFGAPLRPPVSTAPRAERPAEDHPLVSRAKQHHPHTKPVRETAIPTAPPDMSRPAAATTPARVLKNQAIAEALAKEVAPQASPRPRLKRQQSSWLGIVAASIAVMLLGGYLTYIQMPNLSVRVAALQSGIHATYPGYRPDGYAMNGPVQFKSGEVTMQFASNGGDQNFTLKQQRSSWDSLAVKHYVNEQAHATETQTVDGLTIYTYGTNAAWVNRGIFYQITGNAPLSGEQIQKIATSL